MAKQSRLTLLLPDSAVLFANELNRASLPEAFNQLLKKARFQADERGVYRHLCDLFSSQPQAGSDIPMARLRGGSASSLCADPCYLHPDRDKLLLFYRDLDVTLDEAQGIAAAVQPLLDDFHASLQVLTPEEWIVEMPTLPDVSFTAKEGLHSLPVTAALPQGHAAADWTRLWNEIQMLLFDNEVNQQREAAGKVPINSLWFWGGADWPHWQSWSHVSGQDRVLAKLAIESGSGFQPDTQHYADIRMLPAVHVTAFDMHREWEPQLAAWLNNWLLPAMTALKTWRLKQLDIIVPEWGSYSLTPLASWRFWR